MKIYGLLFSCLVSFGLLTAFLVSESAAHPAQAQQLAFEHVLMSSDHFLALVLMGVMIALCMICRKRIIAILGNFSLLGFLIYHLVNHSFSHSALFGLEFLMVGGFVSLVAWRAAYFAIQSSIRLTKHFNSVVFRAVKIIDGVKKFPIARAHCDIPCKIYDPHIATVSALSVVRLIDIMEETRSTGDSSNGDFQNTITRCIQRKEEESEKLKQEVRIIWGDYFKEPQFEKHPEIHNLVHEIMTLASATKQTVDREKGLRLLASVNKFAEIFWSTKNIETEKKIAPYPPSLEIIRPKL